MYCKKCKYHAFDHVSTCPKCGADWEETRKALYLNWLTSRGHDWFAAPTPQVQKPVVGAPKIPVRADQPKLQDDYLNLETPVAPTLSEEIEVSLLPDLDFGLEEPQPAPMATKLPTPPKPEPPTPELFLNDKAIEDMAELDFSLSVDTSPPAPKPSAPKPTPSRRDELFIPELEEMLAPLTEEPKAPAAGKASKKFSGEDDIFLDFSKEPKVAPTKPDIAELDLLDFDTKK